MEASSSKQVTMFYFLIVYNRCVEVKSAFFVLFAKLDLLK
jgi:hypothetical protein